jgi:hypothetical protein
VAELRGVKSQYAQLAVRFEEQVFVAGRSSEYEALVRTITSLEFSIETFLDDIERSLNKIQNHHLSHSHELNERSRKITTLELIVKGLKLELQDKHVAEEQLQATQLTMNFLNRKMLEADNENRELQVRLQAQRSRDSENSLKEQQLQVQISVLQGIKDTRVAEQAASESRVRLLEERHAQLLTDATTAQKQLTYFRESAEVKDREHKQETKYLAQLVADQEIEMKKLLTENNALTLKITTTKQDFNSAFTATMERERVLKEHVDQVCRERDHLRNTSEICRRARDQSLDRLALSEQLLVEVVENCKFLGAYGAEWLNGEDSSMKQLATANKCIADLHGNQQYLQQLYEARGNELQRLQDELEGFRSNESVQLQIAMTDISRYEKTETSLQEMLRRKETDLLEMESSANELRSAVQELMTELSSERERQLLKADAAAADISRLENREASLLASLQEQTQTITRMQKQMKDLEAAAASAPNASKLSSALAEMNEALSAKTQEVFDLTRANMVGESRIDDLQRKLADAMVTIAKDSNGHVNLELQLDAANAQLHSGNCEKADLQMQLEAAKEQLQSGNCELESVCEQLKNAQTDLNKLGNELQTKDKELQQLKLRSESLQAEVENMRAKVVCDGDYQVISQVMKEKIAQKDAELSELRPCKARLDAREEELRMAKEDAMNMKHLVEEKIAQKDAELFELRPYKESLDAKEEELRRAKEEFVCMKQLLDDMQQRMIHAEKELQSVQAIQNQTLLKSRAEDNLRAEKDKIEEEKVILEDNLQNLFKVNNALQNELKDTQAAYFESQVACNKFEAKSSALATELYELQQLQLEVKDTRMSNGRASNIEMSKLNSSQEALQQNTVPEGIGALLRVQPKVAQRSAPPRAVQNEEVSTSPQPQQQCTSASQGSRLSSVPPPPPSASQSPQSVAERLKSAVSVESEPPPCFQPAPLPLAQLSQTELGGDASARDLGTESEPFSEGCLLDTDFMRNEEVCVQHLIPPVSMHPMRPPRDISASATPRPLASSPRPMAPSRHASSSVRSWLSPKTQTRHMQEKGDARG